MKEIRRENAAVCVAARNNGGFALKTRGGRRRQLTSSISTLTGAKSANNGKASHALLQRRRHNVKANRCVGGMAGKCEMRVSEKSACGTSAVFPYSAAALLQ